MAVDEGNWHINQQEVSTKLYRIADDGSGFNGTVNNYVADGAIDPTDSLALCTTPCDAVSLAAGTEGHVITVKSLSGTADNLVLTPASFNDGTDVTFDADDEWCMLQSDGTNWHVIATNATVA